MSIGTIDYNVHLLIMKLGQQCPGFLQQIIRKGKVMKILSLALLLMASMAFVLLGCSENTNPLLPTSDQTYSSSQSSGLAKGGAVVHSASGGGHMSQTWGMEVKWTISFSALQHADGSSAGQIQFVDPSGMSFHGKILDLYVEGNKAKLCWTFTSGVWKGLFGCMLVADYGEGKGAASPDLVSGILWTDGSDIGTGTIAGIKAMSPDEFIAWLEGYLFPFLGIPPGLPVLEPISHGNIQVR
jgi:hypothetical protein